jgi:hypothetical protein
MLKYRTIKLALIKISENSEEKPIKEWKKLTESDNKIQWKN